MKLTIKLISLFMLLLLASPLMLLKGCGGKSSGACPDSVAPSGSKIVAPTNLGAPSAAAGGCFSGLAFTVTDGTNPLNGICVVVTTDAAIALTTPGDLNCSNAINGPKTTIITRTDDSGNVVVDFVTPPTSVGTTFFVQVQSGALSALATTPGAK